MPELGEEDLVPEGLGIPEAVQVGVEQGKPEDHRVHGDQHDEQRVEGRLVVEVPQHDDGQQVAFKDEFLNE